jgi:ABC-type multidrug transport system ATPase subunit
MLDGHDVSSSLSEAFQSLGFCNQMDAHWLYVTLREHLEIYATLKGVVPADVPMLVD